MYPKTYLTNVGKANTSVQQNARFQLDSLVHKSTSKVNRGLRINYLTLHLDKVYYTNSLSQVIFRARVFDTCETEPQQSVPGKARRRICQGGMYGIINDSFTESGYLMKHGISHAVSQIRTNKFQ